MKIVITEKQLNSILTEQSKIVSYAKDLYNKFFGDKEEPEPQKVSKPTILPFTPKNFAAYVKQVGIVHPDVAIAQAMLESGSNFDSNLFKEHNNLFGMKFPAQRSTTAIDKTKNKFSKYKNWQDSVLDYKLWQNALKMTNLDKTKYLAKLDKIYCFPPDCEQNGYSKIVMSLLSRAKSLL